MKQLYNKIMNMLAALNMFVGMCAIGIICSLPIVVLLAPLVYELTIGGFYSK